jgi:hypothetical protein
VNVHYVDEAHVEGNVFVGPEAFSHLIHPFDTAMLAKEKQLAKRLTASEAQL